MRAAGRYRYLFSPLRIGPLALRNRIVFAAHLTNYAEAGHPTEQHAAYYEARARGGAGLIITEAVHRHGTPILAQINHNGGQASGMYSRLPIWAASPVADPMFREVAKEVDHAEIAEIVTGYARTARHCAEGGFDGIELQCS